MEQKQLDEIEQSFTGEEFIEDDIIIEQVRPKAKPMAKTIAKPMKKEVKEIKKDFPIFNTAKGKKLVYLDNGATTQKPADVINALQKFFSESNANIHRGVYSLSQKATGLYENARKTVAGFINAGEDEIIFTKGATESLNALAYTIRSYATERPTEQRYR